MGLQNEKIAALSFVTADLNYLAPSHDRPRTYTYEPPAGVPRSSIVPEPHSVPVHDLRPISEKVSLDREGFALVRQKSLVKDFYDEDEIKDVYYPEAERLIKAVTGADRVSVFDHTVRRRVEGAADRDGGLRQPVARVHVDHTEKSGPQRVRDLINPVVVPAGCIAERFQYGAVITAQRSAVDDDDLHPVQAAQRARVED